MAKCAKSGGEMQEQTAMLSAAPADLARAADEVERRAESRAERRSEVRPPSADSAVSAVAHAGNQQALTSRLAQPPTSELSDAPAPASEGSVEACASDPAAASFAKGEGGPAV